jgi:hypothetical protein
MAALVSHADSWGVGNPALTVFVQKQFVARLTCEPYQARIPCTTLPCTGWLTQSPGIMPCFAWRPQVAGHMPGLRPGRQARIPFTTVPCTSVNR